MASPNPPPRRSADADEARAPGAAEAASGPDDALAEALLVGTTDGVLLVEAVAWTILVANDAAAALLDTTTSDLAGRPLGELLPNVADVRATFEALAGGAALPLGALAFERRSGGLELIDVRVAAVAGADGCRRLLCFLRAASERLQNSQLESLLTQSEVFFAVVAPDGSVIAANRSPPAGHEPADGVVRLHDHVDGRDRDAVDDLLATARGGETTTRTFRLARSDGLEQVVSALAVPVGTGGPGAQIVVLANDVTEALRVERELGAVERSFRELIQASPNVFYRIAADEPRVVTFMGPQIEQLTGYPLESWIGRDGYEVWTERMHPDDRALVPEWAEVDARQGSWTGEYRLRHADGHDVWVLDVSTYVIGLDGERVEQGTLVDVTERKLQESLFRLYVETAPIVAYRCVLDGESRVVYMSPQVERMLGYPAESWLGPDQDGTWAERMHPDDRGLTEVWKVSDGVGAAWSGEYRLRHADGHYLTVLDSYANAYDLTGRHVQQGFLMDVSDRVRAERAHRAAERRYRELVENLPALLLSASPDGGLELVNRTWRDALGYGVDDPVPETLLEVVDEESREECASALDRCANGEAVSAVELRLLGKDGRIVLVRGTVTPQTEDGRVVAINAVLQDVTEQVRSERRLRESLDSLEDGLWLLALDPPRVTYVNPGMAGILRREHAELADGLLLDGREAFVHPDDRARARAAFDRWLGSRGAEPYELELRVVRPDGVVRWVAERGTAVRDERDVVIALQGHTRDITETKLGEQAVSGWVHDAMVVLDERGAVVSWNAGAERMFGWDASDMIGGTLDAIIPQDLRAAHAERISALAAGAAPVSLDRLRELRAVGRDGAEFPVTVVVSRWESGGRPFYSGVIHDVSERVERELELAAARDEVAHLSEVRQELVHMLVHDLRGPLTGIRLAGEMLARDESLAGDAREIAAQLVSGADRLERLVDDVLLSARLESDTVALDRTREPLRPIVEAAAQALGAPAAARVELVGDAWPDVSVDRELVDRVLENLIGNALKFSPAGSPVTVRAGIAGGGAVAVSVADRGRGVPDAFKDVVFDRFRIAGHPDRAVRQTGLGLSFCRLAVAAHGGEITVSDNEPCGAVFTFTLPLAGEA